MSGYAKELENGTVFSPRFNADGLLPVITQEAKTGQLLMLAYMNEEALRRTLASGEMWYYSRSRAEFWRKGATSGHTQRLVALRVDCDQDALLAQVEQVGAACHTGQSTCFYREVDLSATPTSGDQKSGSLTSEGETTPLPPLVFV